MRYGELRPAPSAGRLREVVTSRAAAPQSGRSKDRVRAALSFWRTADGVYQPRFDGCGALGPDLFLI